MNKRDIDRLLIVGPNDGAAFWVGGHRVTIKAGGTDTDGLYRLIESRISVGNGPPLHVHHGVDEAVWVIQGQVRFRCGERDFTVVPGSFVLLPRDMPHTFLVVGEQDAVLLGLLTPGGSERYFTDIGVPVVTSPSPPAGATGPRGHSACRREVEHRVAGRTAAEAQRLTRSTV